MPVQFITAIPKLASLNIERSVAFFLRLGFTQSAVYPDYGIVQRDEVQLHFWRCEDANIPKATGCRVNVIGIDALFEAFNVQGVIHPNDPLSTKPWGMREFSILDPDGNLVTFAEQL
jgi:hypothetical protein